MLNTPDSISELLQGTLLAGKEILQLEIPQSTNYAFAIQISADQDIAAWNLMRSKLEMTKRYPVLVCSWSFGPTSWAQEITDNDFFSRFYYEEEVFQGEHQNTAPEAIIARVPEVNLDAFFEQQKTRDGDDWVAEVSYYLAETERCFGRSPSSAEVQSLIHNHILNSQMEFERWLLDWERLNFDEQTISSIDTSHLAWFEPNSTKVLLLLPITDSWNALAYLHWYGACSIGSEVAIACLQHWHQSYNTELVCHYGTMLQLQVSHPPASLNTAFELAWEQYSLAPYTLQAPGISLRAHARALVSLNQWFLHERP